MEIFIIVAHIYLPINNFSLLFFIMSVKNIEDTALMVNVAAVAAATKVGFMVSWFHGFMLSLL